MKKAILAALILSLLMATLTACGAEAQQPTTPEPTPKIEEPKPEPLAAPEKVEISQEELEPIFEQVYTEASENHPEDWSVDFQITDEIGKITKAIPEDKKAPVNLREIYIEWRTAKTDPEPTAEPEPEPENTLTFTDADEMMYTTGTVNIRTGPGTSYDKIDSLPKAWPVHRIGIGNGTAEGWSLIEFEDGSTACVSSNYLSYTKPSSGNAGNNGGSTQQSSGTQQSGSTQQNSGTQQSGESWGDFHPNAGKTQEQLQQELEEAQNTEFRINGTPGGASGGEAGGAEFIESIGGGLEGLDLITDGSGGIVHNPDA